MAIHLRQTMERKASLKPKQPPRRLSENSKSTAEQSGSIKIADPSR